MGGGQGLGDGGHAHRVRTQNAHRADLGGGLKLGAGEEVVHALVNPQVDALGAVLRKLSQRGGVHVGHVEEAGAEFVHIGAAQRAVTGQLDVILDDHDVARAVGLVHRAGGVGQDGGLHAQQLEQAHRDHQLLKIVALVGVEAAGHADHLFARHRAEDQLARVGIDGGDQEVRDVLVVDDDGILDGVRKRAQAGAQHEGHLRRVGNDALDIVGGFLEIFVGIAHGVPPACPRAAGNFCLFYPVHCNTPSPPASTPQTLVPCAKTRKYEGSTKL